MLKEKLKRIIFDLPRKHLFTDRGAVIDKGAIYIVVILTLLIFGAYIFVGGTLPTKLPKVSTELVALHVPPPQPTKTGLQLYTFYGATHTPHPTQAPRPTSPISELKLVECGRPVTGSKEPQMVWGYELAPSAASGNELALKVFYTNKHALVLGAGAITQMGKHPAEHATNPAIGDVTVKDQDGFPLFPAIFLTDITSQPANISGDAQAGGQANKPDALFGTWKAAGAPDPVENGRNLGPGADSFPPANGPPGVHDANFTTEIVWQTGKLRALDPAAQQYIPLQSGHTYRGQIVLHDGGSPMDIATACVQFRWPGDSEPAPIAASCASQPPAGGQTYTSTRSVSGSGITSDGDTYSASGSSECLKISSASNITIRNSTFRNCHGIKVDNSTNIVIENNKFENVTRGVYVLHSKQGNIKVRNNTFASTVWAEAAIQFNQVSGPGLEISYNQIAQIPQQLHRKGPGCVTNPSMSCWIPDTVNLYKTCGTPASPVRLIGNYIKGGHQWRSDSGILLGDSPDSGAACGYYLAQYNTVIDGGGGNGIHIGGSNTQVLDNVVFGSKGRKEAWAGIQVYGYAGKCSNNTFKRNLVRWWGGDGVERPFVRWVCPPVDGLDAGDTSTNNLHADLNRCSKHPNTPAWCLDVDYPECRKN